MPGVPNPTAVIKAAGKELRDSSKLAPQQFGQLLVLVAAAILVGSVGVTWYMVDRADSRRDAVDRARWDETRALIDGVNRDHRELYREFLARLTDIERAQREREDRNIREMGELRQAIQGLAASVRDLNRRGQEIDTAPMPRSKAQAETRSAGRAPVDHDRPAAAVPDRPAADAPDRHVPAAVGREGGAAEDDGGRPGRRGGGVPPEFAGRGLVAPGRDRHLDLQPGIPRPAPVQGDELQARHRAGGRGTGETQQRQYDC